MKTITINGTNFELSTPYQAGAVTLTEAEAKTLNQTRAENIGNNFRAQVKKAMEEGQLAEVTAAIAEYDAKYNFSMGGTARTPIDPIEAEAIKIAREVVKAKLAEKGHKVKDYTATEVGQARYDAAVEKTAQQDDTIKLAKQRVNLRKKSMEVASEDLGL